MKRVLVLVVFALLPGPALAQAPEISDSAGVRVVTNAAPGPNAPRFRLSPRRVSIGLIEGAPEYLLSRVLSGMVLRDGSIAIANGGTSQVRIYDRTGKYLRSLGREGQGPGEFGSIAILGVLGDDSLLISDVRQKRFSIFTTGGEFVRTIRVPEEMSFSYETHGLLANRRVVVTPIVVPTSPPPSRTVVRRRQSILWMPLDGGPALPFGEFPGTESFSSGLGGIQPPLIFGRGLHVFAREDRIAVANDDAYSIRIYDGAGKLLQVVRERREPPPARAGEFEQAISPALKPDDRMRKSLEAQPHRETKPPFGGGCPNGCVRFDQAGNLWVREYIPGSIFMFGNDPGSTWHLFDPRGVFTGSVVLPPKTFILDAGADWVLVNQRDDLDVPHVVLYGLERQ